MGVEEIHWFQELLRINRMPVYAAYGLVFILLGVSVAVQSLNQTRMKLGKHLWLLSAFGLTHGFTEWGDVFIPIQGAYLSSYWVTLMEFGRLGLLLSSFLFLLLFGIHMLIGADGRRLSVWATLLLGSAGLLIMTGVGLLPPGASLRQVLIPEEIWVRYLAGFPAAALAGVALYRKSVTIKAQGFAHIGRWLKGAAWAFGIYGILAGLITPTYYLLQPMWGHDSFAADLFGTVLPLLRAMPATVVAVNIIRSLRVFQIETDRLLEEAQHTKLLVAERELTALSDVAVALGGSQTYGSVPSAVLVRVSDLFKLNQSVVVLADRSGQPIAFAGANEPDLTAGHLHRLISCSLQSQQLISEPGGEGEWGIGIPVSAKGQQLGVLALVGTGEINLSDLERQCVISIGNQIGIAMENGRLWQEVQRKEEMRSELLSRVINAQEEERRRVARELHDGIGQTLSALVIRAGAAIEALPPSATRAEWILEGNRELLTESIDELRNLIYQLRPAALDDLGLVPALRRLGKQLGQDAGFHFSLHSTGLAKRLPKAIETELFRITQEALTNVVKHADASRVMIRLAVMESELVGMVSDNGKGFDLKGALEQGGERSYGLLGMTERASLVGGELKIKTGPGHGTRLEVRIPLKGVMLNEEPYSHLAGG